MVVKIRRAQGSDSGVCARILQTAFNRVFSEHGFNYSTSSLTSVEAFVARLIRNRKIYGVVAELDGAVIGSNFLDERDAVRGLGPITVDPDYQGHGAGRALVLAVLRRARGSKGIRLLQDSFNMHSLSLYVSLGFEVREPIALVSGKPSGKLPRGFEARPMRAKDLEDCNAVCSEVHGYTRENELIDQLRTGSAWVTIRDGRVTAYVSNLTSWRTSHGVAKTTTDMEAVLLEGSRSLEKISLLLPVRQSDLFKWFLKNNFRAIQPMTYMSRGFYQKPQGCYFPTIHS